MTILRYLAPTPAKILDIGGGPGFYAGWLAQLGYDVELLDYRAQARRAGQPRVQGPIGRCAFPALCNTSADAGAPLFAAAISRFASLMDGLMRGLIDDPAFPPMMMRDLDDGQHRNLTGNPEFFTEAYFHRPADLRKEIAEAGFSDVAVYGVEGPVWVAPDFTTRWEDPQKRTQLLDLARRVEREEELLGLSMHLLAVARA